MAKGKIPEKALRLVAVAQGLEIRTIRELTFDEESAYIKAQEHLLNHDEAGWLTEIVRRNLFAFEDCVKGYANLVPVAGQRGVLSRDAKLDVNRHFLNFLSAVRQFLDHTETRLKRLYANNPEIFKAFKKRTAKAFDSVFAYRLLYKLRNYSQHCGAPIGIVEYESKLKPGTRETVHTLHLFLDAQHLLRTGGDVWGPVRADLKKLGSNFPVDELPRLVVTEIEAIWAVVQQSEKPFLESCAQTVLETVRDVPPPYITPAVARFWHGKTETTIQLLNPPTGTMAWLGHNTFREIF
ncbi:hypothetical protein LOY64_01535 [Pseudomonas corrugata]|uniref:hypothetical protein n=1 Tax=Pseudomonas corrugata TaxID=47879 RepID=UPI002232131C|nr:hypothetical protein [Pseudomonas corrugata]UZD95722.1 hypothetical protein LOY64_01535 [Pseudomonas corrugata]